MSAFNAFFAQLTGGGNAAGGDPSSTSTAAAAAPDPRGTPATGGGGSGAGGGGGGGEVFGVPLAGAAITYGPESDRSRFGNPQVRFRVFAAAKRGRGGVGDASAMGIFFSERGGDTGVANNANASAQKTNGIWHFLVNRVARGTLKRIQMS